MRNAECGVRNVTVRVARRTTSHFTAAFRIPHSALVHTDATRLSRREDGEVTHAVTHTPHPTHPSGLRIGWPPASRASARSPTGQARAHTPHGTPWNVMQRSGSSSRIPRCTPAQPAAGDALLGAHPHLLEQAAERLAEETAPVARPRVHQKVGPRLTCQRNAKVLSPRAKSRALSQRFTASGTSKRIVQASSFT